MAGIRVEIELADGSFTSGMLRAGQTVSSFRKELARVDPHFAKAQKGANGYAVSVKRADVETKSLLSTMRDVSIVGGFAVMAMRSLTGASGGLIGSIVKVNSEMERLRFQMQGMSIAADPIKDAANSVNYLRDMAGRVPFSLGEITSSFVKLKATGTDPMGGSLQALADGIAAFGGTDEQLHRVTLGITQMSGKAVIQMEEMRQQLGESMPSAMRIMARSMGVSVASLTKSISTGRVEAKSALESFYAELERSFGGEAQRMMGTFSGQVAQMKVNLQKLATNEGLSGFVDELKNGLLEINGFLKSDRAVKFANDLGSAMSTATRSIVSITNTVFEFRREIMTLAKIVGAGIGIKVLAGGLLGVTQAFVMASMGVRAFGASMASSASYMALGVSGMGSISTAAIGSKFAMLGAGMAAKTLITSFAAVAPLVFALGGAVYLAASHFGVFKDKTKDAYEELIKFGAESRKQAEQISKDEEARLRAFIARAEADLVVNTSLETTSSNPEMYQDMNKQLREKISREKEALEEVVAMREDIISTAGSREDSQRLAADERRLRDQERVFQTEYSKASINLDQLYEQELIAASKGAESAKKVDERYQRKTMEVRTRLAQQKLDNVDAEIRKSNEIIEVGNAEEVASANAHLQLMMDRRIQYYGELKALKENGMGVTLMNPPVDDEKKIEKGQKLLNSLKDDIEGLKEEMTGASGEYKKMLERIARGTYGNIDDATEAVTELHGALADAVAEKEALDKLMKGKNKLEADVERARIDALEKRAELQKKLSNTDMTESESIMLRINQGFYDGFGPIGKIQEAILAVVGSMDIQGAAANDLSSVMQRNAFGDPTLVKIKSVEDAIRDVSEEVMNLATGLGGINFDVFSPKGMAGTRSLKGFSGGMLDLIGKMEGTDKGRGYNETLDYGKWTGGPKDLVKMTLDEILVLGDSMRTPENRATYEGGGSSALGRYQIVGQTMRGLMKEMGLSGGELFNEAMQDAMATRLIAKRGGGLDPVGMGQEWQSMKGIDAQTLADAMARGATGPTRQNAGAQITPSPMAAPTYDNTARQKAVTDMMTDQILRQAAFAEELRKTATIEAENLDLGEQLARQTYMDDLIAKSAAAGKNVEDLGKNYGDIIEAIKAGDLGRDTDVASEKYVKLIEAARQLDVAEKRTAEIKKAQKASDAELVKLKKEEAEILKKIADEQARAADPNYKATSEDLRRLNEQLDEYLNNIQIQFGVESAEYATALAKKSAMLGNQTLLDATTRQADAAKARREIEESMMTASQQRRLQRDRDIADVESLAAAKRAAGMNDVQVTEQAESMKKAIRDKYAAESNPMIGQMQQWSDVQGNLMDASTGWMDGLAGGLSTLDQGTANLSSALGSIANDLKNMLFKMMISGLLKGIGGSMGGGAGAGGGMFGSFLSGFGGGNSVAAVKHTGGIAGDGRGSHASVSGSLFAGAPKFHGGGIVGGGTKLLPSEVPIIAKKDEGIFTPEQMASLGGFQQNQQVVMSPTINVSGGGGSGEQNADLAKKITRELENSMTGKIQQELQKQMRPGAMLNNRGR